MVLSSSGQMVRTIDTSRVENDVALDRNGMAYCSPADGGLRCFDASFGSSKWYYEERVDNFILPFSSPSVDADGTVYVGSTSGTLHAVTGNMSNGISVAKWKYVADSPIRSSPSIAADGSIVFTTDSGKIYCVDSNGSLKWTFSTGGKISAPVVISSNGVCYVGSQDGFFYAITMNGSQLWQYNANSPIYGGAAVSGDGLIYFVSYDGYLHCLQ
jgi:outer membrane protein assembly factor BamB